MQDFNFSVYMGTSIDASIFQGCNNLKKFNVDGSNINIRTVYDSVYSHDGETLILFPPGKESAIIVNATVRFADNAFAWSNVLRSVYFLSGSMLETFGSSSFYYCKSLSSIQFPPRLTEIKTKCFMGCTSLKSVNLPDSLRNIEQDAFSECSSLRNVKYCGTNKIEGTHVFMNTLTIRVTDIYPYDTFCSNHVTKSLKSDCEVKYQFACSCLRRTPTPISRLSTMIILMVYQ